MLLYYVLKASKIWRMKIVPKLSRFMEKFRVHPNGLRTYSPVAPSKGKKIRVSIISGLSLGRPLLPMCRWQDNGVGPGGKEDSTHFLTPWDPRECCLSNTTPGSVHPCPTPQNYLFSFQMNSPSQ